MNRWMLVMLAACGSKHEPTKTESVVDRCHHVVDHMNDLDRKTTGGSGVGSAEAEELVQLCAKEWSSALIDCLIAVKDPAGLEACKKLAPKQAMDPVDATAVVVKKLAFEAYPTWAASHPDNACPDKLDDLLEFVSREVTAKDAWGTPFQMYCGATLPPGARGLAIVSAGPDGKLGTADDIKSW